MFQKMNGGKKGWNYDEPAVFQAVCELAVRRFFSTVYTDGAITEFVSDMRSKIAVYKAPPEQQDIEAVIRAAFDDNSVRLDNIERAELYNIHGAVTANIVDKLALNSRDVDRLIADAEQIAIERGYNPPIASETV
jgi:hypothetical protein